MDEAKLEKLLSLLEKINVDKLEKLVEQGDKPKRSPKKKTSKKATSKKTATKKTIKKTTTKKKVGSTKKKAIERPQYGNPTNFELGPRENKFEELIKNPRFARMISAEEKDFDKKVQQEAKRLKKRG